jgi:hypothetical protein
MLYTVMRYAGRGTAVTIERRKRIDAAADLTWREIHAMLSGEALLDRPVAVNLQKEFNTWVLDKDLRSKMDGKKVFSLRKDDPHTCVVINWEHQ